MKKGLRSDTQSVRKFSQNGNRSLSRINAQAQKLNGAFSGLSGQALRFVGILGTTALAGASFKNVANYEERLKKFGVAADVTSGKMQGFQKNLSDISIDNNITTSSEQLLGASETFLSRTGNVLSGNQLRAIGLVQTAVGGLTEQYGEIFATLKNGGLTEQEQIERFTQLYAVGKKASIPLNELARIYPLLNASASSFGGNIADNFAFSNALVQTIKDVKGSAEESATGLEQYSRVLTDLQTKGIIAHDASLAESSDEIFNILDKFKGQKQLQAIEQLGFTKETIPVVRYLLQNRGKIKEFYQLPGEYAKLQEDANKATIGFNQQIRRISNVLKYRLNANFLPLLNRTSEWLASLSSQQIDRFIDRIIKLGKQLAILYIGFKSARLISNITGLGRGVGGAGIAGQSVAGLGSSALKPLYVYNVNGKGLAGAGITGETAGGDVRGKSAGRGSKLLRAGARGAPALLALATPVLTAFSGEEDAGKKPAFKLQAWLLVVWLVY